MIIKEQICRKVDACRGEALEFLQECIRTPSVTGEELQMARVVTKWIEKSGLLPEWYEKEKDRPNVVARWSGSEEGRQFVLNGHMDVFPPVEGKAGFYGPWSGKVVDGYIYGRGSVDMKSGLCAGILAVKYLRELGFSPKGSILLTCVSDEENCGVNGTKYLIDEGVISGKAGDLGICMEPTRCKVLVQHCGGATIRITYESESGHTSMPHNSIDALTKSIHAIEKLYNLAEQIKQRYNEEMGVWSLLSITMMESGNTSNMYPSKSSFVIDRRLLPGESLDQAHAEIHEVLDKLKSNNPLYEYNYEIWGEYPALFVDENEEIVRIAMEAYNVITGENTAIYKRGGASDASDIVEGAHIPMPNFGAGNDVEESTSENEKLFLEDYYTFIKVYMMMIVKAFESNDID